MANMMLVLMAPRLPCELQDSGTSSNQLNMAHKKTSVTSPENVILYMKILYTGGPNILFIFIILRKSLKFSGRILDKL
jgi:hypothetical protein